MQRYLIDLTELVTILILPVFCLMAVIYRLFKATTTKNLFVISGLTLTICCGILYDWSRDQEIRSSVILSGYHIHFVERPGPLEHARYFEVVRSDKKQAYYYIDEDAHKCENFNVTKDRSRVYFHCSRDYTSDRVSYVDTEKHMLYAGYSKASQQIDTLEFK